MHNKTDENSSDKKKITGMILTPIYKAYDDFCIKKTLYLLNLAKNNQENSFCPLNEKFIRVGNIIKIEEFNNSSFPPIYGLFYRNLAMVFSPQKYILDNFPHLNDINFNEDKTLYKAFQNIDEEFRKYCIIDCMYKIRAIYMENSYIEINFLENKYQCCGNLYKEAIGLPIATGNLTTFRRLLHRLHEKNNQIQDEFIKSHEYYSKYKKTKKIIPVEDEGLDHLHLYFRFYFIKYKNGYQYYTDEFLCNLTYRYLCISKFNRNFTSYTKELFQVYDKQKTTSEQKHLNQSKKNLEYWINSTLSGLKPNYEYMTDIDNLLYHYKYEKITHLNFLKMLNNVKTPHEKSHKALTDDNLNLVISYYDEIMKLPNSINNNDMVYVLIDLLYQQKEEDMKPLDYKISINKLFTMVQTLKGNIDRFTQNYFCSLYEYYKEHNEDDQEPLKILYDDLLEVINREDNIEIKDICKPNYLDFNFDISGNQDIIFFRMLSEFFKLPKMETGTKNDEDSN